MVSVLDLHERPPEPPAAPVVEGTPAAPVVEQSAAPEEFEFVLGRRQVASVLFVATIILMVCIAGAYLAGKAISAKAPAPAAPAVATQVREPDPPPIVLNQEPEPEAPLFSDPRNGSVYIQMGAVEKGVSVIFAEGLRKRGLNAFVAPGPNEKIFRVLIGPLPDPAAYVRAKDAVDKLGLSTFARRFPN